MTNLFFDKGSPQGKEKEKFLTIHRVICPTFDGVQPPHRITWEIFTYYMQLAQEQVAEELRMCRKGSDSADVFESLSIISPMERLLLHLVEQFFPRITPYIPNLDGIDFAERGFDMDVFVLANDCKNPRIYCELFPRFITGQQNHAWMSKIAIPNVPLAKINVPSRYGEISEEIMTWIRTGEDQSGLPLPTIARNWDTFRGCWHLRDQISIALFLHWVAFSICSSSDEGKESLVAAQVTKDGLGFGRNMEGILHFTKKK
ncbi:MAG: hypothetical protein AAB604_01320 [Patescibacteria group bacterium]